MQANWILLLGAVVTWNVRPFFSLQWNLSWVKDIPVKCVLSSFMAVFVRTIWSLVIPRYEVFTDSWEGTFELCIVTLEMRRQPPETKVKIKGDSMILSRHTEFCKADRTTWKLTLQDINTTPKEPKTERGRSRRQQFRPFWGSLVRRNEQRGSAVKFPHTLF